MVDQFGVTLHGYKIPVKSYMREDFAEPKLASYVPKKLSPGVGPLQLVMKAG